MKRINLEKKKMKPLTNRDYESNLNQTNCHINKKQFEDEYTNNTKSCIVRDHCHYTGKYRDAAHNVCKLKYSIPKEILVVFTMD